MLDFLLVAVMGALIGFVGACGLIYLVEFFQ